MDFWSEYSDCAICDPASLRALFLLPEAQLGLAAGLFKFSFCDPGATSATAPGLYPLEPTVSDHGALSPAEKALAQSPAGAAQVQEYHQQLFKSSFETLRLEIKQITGVEVREATAEIETSTGTVVRAFTSGTVAK